MKLNEERLGYKFGETVYEFSEADAKSITKTDIQYVIDVAADQMAKHDFPMVLVSDYYNMAIVISFTDIKFEVDVTNADLLSYCSELMANCINPEIKRIMDEHYSKYLDKIDFLIQKSIHQQQVVVTSELDSVLENLDLLIVRAIAKLEQVDPKTISGLETLLESDKLTSAVNAINTLMKPKAKRGRPKKSSSTK